MAQKNRTKEIWLIPKRVNLHQTVCLIDGIIERKYDGTNWKPQKQNNLGVNLKNWGATKDGKNISQQAIRTLVASIPQYLGFLYINSEKTPNTICLTKAGKELWHEHKDHLVKVPNLVSGKESLITQSNAVLRQMEKLQITNPIINKDCKNISVFPFRFMLKVLLEVKYLDQEEIAFFLFKVTKQDEVESTVEEIRKFRNMSCADRKALINDFKGTHIGNITLVKAPSAGYFMSLCQMTGIIDKVELSPKNRDAAIAALKINAECLEYVKHILEVKYKQSEVYDFGDDLQLWVDYMGDPSRDHPPIKISFINKLNSKFLIQVFDKDNQCKHDDLMDECSVLRYPLFVNEEYNVKIIDVTNGDELQTVKISPSFEQREYVIEGNIGQQSVNPDTVESVVKDITEHCQATNFAGKTLNYLRTLSKVTGKDKTSDPSLRGAYFEYFMYKLLNILKQKKVVDEVVWNGKIGKYGLPTQAPGGTVGTPDIVFSIDELDVVVELTTIKSKSKQFSAEGSSVPDHIRLHKQQSGKEVVGVFCAPIIHERNTTAMQSAIAQYGIQLHCMTVDELLEVLLTEDRKKIKNSLK